MADKTDTEKHSIAEMLHDDIMCNYCHGDKLSVKCLMGHAHDYIRTLEANCSASEVLSAMESLGFIQRRKKEYIFQDVNL